jgi:hypothetical protein
MSGLWTHDRDTLVTWLADSYAGPEPYEGYNDARVDDLLARGDVRVLDPDNTELVERIADLAKTNVGTARNVIWALRQP